MLVKNVLIENDPVKKAIRVEDGKIMQIGDLQGRENEEVYDFEGKLLLPPFVESHVHLDTCMTAGDPRWNMSGNLFEGIEIWSERKEKLNREDIRERVTRMVKLYASHGVQFIRTHVDVTDPSLMALRTMLELKEELKDIAEIQIVADHIAQTKKKLNQILAENTGQPLEVVERDTERDHYMTAEEAKAYGLIDGVVEHK